MDRIFEAYTGSMGDEFMRKTRERLKWICEQVSGTNVLDVGCSQGICPILLGQAGFTVLGMDINSDAIAFAAEKLQHEESSVQRGVKFVQGNFATYSLDSRCFDTVIFGEVLEHLLRPEIFIAKAHSVLNAGGRVVITVPFGINDDPDHKQTFYFSRIKRILYPYFDIRAVRYFGSWIGFVAIRRDEMVVFESSADFADLENVEQAVFGQERQLRDRITALSENARRQSENAVTQRDRAAKLAADLSKCVQDKGALEKAKEAVDAKLADVTKKTVTLETMLHKLETEKSALAERASSAESAVAKLETEKSALAERASSAERTVARLETEKSALAERASSAERTVARLETEKSALAERASSAERTVAKLETEKSALVERASSVERAVAKLETEKSALAAHVAAVERDVAETSKSLSERTKQLAESENCRQIEKRAHQRFSRESYERGKELKRVQADLIKIQEVCCDLDKSRALADAAYDKLAKSKLGRLTIRYWKLKDGKRGGEHSIRKSRSIRSTLEEALRQLLSVKVKIPTCDAAKTEPASRLSPVASSAQKRREAHVVGLATAQWKDFKAEQIRVSRMIEPELRKSGEVAEADRLRTGIRVAEGQLVVGAPMCRAASRRIVEGRLKVATILDTFSDSCFGAECDLVRITPENWRNVLAKERPDMLLVESAWNGNGGSWQYLIGTYGGSTRDKLRELLQGCRELGIPTAFWNKEDPPHFDKFIEAASLFDHVFTTDENCIPKYRQMCGHNRVSALPFAAAPTIHNPIVEGPRDRDVCFAGTYYANRFEDRRKQMDVLLECAHGFNFDIYDRMFGNKNPGFENYLFPEKFRPYIRGKLDYADMLKAYRRYKFFLNTNSVVDSGTMFSRRVFELLACGTPVITTPSVGIRRFFGGIVDEIASIDEGRKSMSRLLEDREYYRDLQIRGIREVLSKHTYAIRLEQMAHDLGFVYRRPTTAIAVFAVIGKSGSAAVVETLGRQTVRPKLVVLRGCDEKFSSDIKKAGFEVMISDRLDPVALSRAGVNFAVWMDFSLKYGQDYLLDASLNAQFERGHASGMRATHEMEFRMAEDFLAPTVAVSSDRWKETAQVMDGLFLNGLKGVATLHGYNRPETEFSRS